MRARRGWGEAAGESIAEASPHPMLAFGRHRARRVARKEDVEQKPDDEQHEDHAKLQFVAPSLAHGAVA